MWVNKLSLPEGTSGVEASIWINTGYVLGTMKRKNKKTIKEKKRKHVLL